MKGFGNFSIRKNNNTIIKFLAKALVLLFLLAILNIFSTPIKNAFYVLSAPVQKIFWSAGSSSSFFLGSLLNVGNFAEENKLLNEENQKLLSQIAMLRSDNLQNQAQNNFSALCQSNGFEFIIVGVAGLDGDILSINKGSAYGIGQGMPVISQQNVLLGRVIEVYKNFSKIMLISNKNSVINVRVQTAPGFDEPTSEINGVVKGEGALSAYLDLVPIDDQINIQDVLITSAIDKSFPKDLLVGRIIQKNKNDQKPFQQAQVGLFFDIGSIDNLFVITNYKQTN